MPTVKLNEISQPISIEYKMVHCLNRAVFRTYSFGNLAILDLSSFQLCVRTGIRCYIARKKLDYLFNCKSEISNVCRAVDGQCLQDMKILHHYASGCFDWLISGHQSVNPSREAISILSGNTKDLDVSIQ